MNRYGDLEKVTSLNHTYLCSGVSKTCFFLMCFFHIKTIVSLKVYNLHIPWKQLFLQESWTSSRDSVCFLMYLPILHLRTMA